MRWSGGNVSGHVHAASIGASFWFAVSTTSFVHRFAFFGRPRRAALANYASWLVRSSSIAIPVSGTDCDTQAIGLRGGIEELEGLLLASLGHSLSSCGGAFPINGWVGGAGERLAGAMGAGFSLALP